MSRMIIIIKDDLQNKPVLSNYSNNNHKSYKKRTTFILIPYIVYRIRIYLQINILILTHVCKSNICIYVFYTYFYSICIYIYLYVCMKLSVDIYFLWLYVDMVISSLMGLCVNKAEEKISIKRIPF